ncbi:MAG: hypothetical protein ABIV48_11235, partial [Pyrinomonadaceae bacterium]
AHPRAKAKTAGIPIHCPASAAGVTEPFPRSLINSQTSAKPIVKPSAAYESGLAFDRGVLLGY